MWKGAVSFGLVSIAVKLYSATQEKDIRFHQVHKEDGGRIRYQRMCSKCGEEVSYDEIAKGFDTGGGEMVVLTDEDFADLPLTSSKAIEVLECVQEDEIDPILYHKAYFLEPDGVIGLKPYLLLREALSRSERVAIVKVALRQRETLAVVRVREDLLVLNTMLWPDEIRRPEFEFLGDEVALRPQEVKMATSLVDSLTTEFDPNEFTDSYREALQQVIDAKVGREEIVEKPEVEEPLAETIDLMEALRKSVAKARAARDSKDGKETKPAAATRTRKLKSA